MKSDYSSIFTVKTSQNPVLMKISLFYLNHILLASAFKILYVYFRDIRGFLVSFLKDSARKPKRMAERNPSWMMCLPIVHFLDATLCPFQELDYSNFQDENKVWWIITELEMEKEELKRHQWSRYVISFYFLV